MTTLSRDLIGWFQVGWSSDFPAGEVRPLRYLREELVAFRSPAGELSVLNAYCQHLGAHLGVGGCVTEKGIQCPYHRWVWDGDGRNVEIPYQDSPNRARRIRSWPVTERHGCVYIWSGEPGEDPAWDVPDVFTDVSPDILGRAFHPPAHEHFPGLRLHPQMVIENAVDAGHFPAVHGVASLPTVLHTEVDDVVWHSEVGFGRGWEGLRVKDRPDASSTTIHFCGIGLSFNTLLNGGVAAVVSIAATCVDDTTAELFETVWLEQLSDDESDESVSARLQMAMTPMPQDLDIWNNQIYIDPPGLATMEVRGFNRLRRWSSRFYRDSEHAPKGGASELVP